ncbi:26103_t:CDS:1, partial [Dentiscutata erythropus]
MVCGFQANPCQLPSSVEVARSSHMWIDYVCYMQVRSIPLRFCLRIGQTPEPNEGSMQASSDSVGPGGL